MTLQNINDPEGIKALLDTLRNSQAWADTVGPSLAVQSEGPESSTLPRAAQNVQVSDSSRSRSSGRDSTPASSSSSSGPGPSPGPGPGNTGPSSSSSTTSPIIPSSNSGNSSHSSTPGPSVADLLSKLRPSQSLERLGPASITTTNVAVGNAAVGGERGDRTLERERRSLPPDHMSHASPVPVPVPQSVSTNAFHQPQQDKDIRTLSFHQALPHISQLMEDPHVVEDLTKMKEEQDKLEKQLWEGREVIRRSHEEKVRVAKTKAKMIGVDLSKQEAQLMSDNFQKELRKFDVERALPAWDALVRGQQARLEALKVPTMFVTSETGDVEKQRRVVNVLEGILDHERSS
ncbi:hypothetical protein V8E52_001902 [Russula decolorans]